MSFLKLPKRLHPDFQFPNKKPAGQTERDAGNSLARGLVSFGVFNEYRQTVMRDSVDPGNSFAFKTGAQWTSLDGEIAVETNWDSNGEDHVQADKALLSPSGDWTVNQRLYRKYGTLPGRFLGQYLSGGSGRTYFEIESGSTSLDMFDGSTGHTLTIPQVPVGKWFDIAVRRTGTLFDVFVNGVKADTGITSSASIYQGVGTQYGGVNSGGSLRGAISNQQTYNRALSLSEIIALQRDNYAPLRPKSPLVYFVPSATGPNTPINPSITSLLATSARLNWEQG
jgi:hypothetical protein